MIARKFSPTVFGIIETTISMERVEKLARTLGHDNGYAEGGNIRSGGI